MAISLGNGDGKTVVPVMNVTPLVDVVLVLLIIFMVITPLLTKRFWIHTPKQEREEVKAAEVPPDAEAPLVLRLAADETITVNGTVLQLEEVAERLRRMFAARSDHVLFFDAAADASYGRAVELLDRAREGGAVTIATLTEELAAPAAPPAQP